MMMVSPQTYLPNEILDQISLYLSIQERISVFPAVCKHWYKLAQNELRYDSSVLASQILKGYQGSLTAAELLTLSNRKFQINLENKLFKPLTFAFETQANPDRYQIEFNTNTPQKFQIFKYNRIIKSNYFNIRTDPHIKHFKVSKIPKMNCLKFSCYIETHTLTTTAEMDHRGIPKHATLISSTSIDEDFVIKDKVYFTQGCLVSVKKGTKIHKWKMIKTPESYIKIMQNINSLISFHLTSLIETVSRYNVQYLKKWDSIDSFKTKKMFFCDAWGKISMDHRDWLHPALPTEYFFELYAKEINWHDGKKIVTLQWNDPSKPLRCVDEAYPREQKWDEGERMVTQRFKNQYDPLVDDNFLVHLRHAVFSRTTEFMLRKLGLLEF